ncbi:damage-control phosphatase ARMT1 family protein [Desulfogranum mediterraneum]|uniref:damage-control phosphatase ARMT1 family protein n=1 Tax=Desulfogranum mediterraneum TaxID=160661 RepID=UPI0003F79A27|nr:ARMT1-like domain-containing protein [Desulfogranum mediterraneum]
MQTGNDCLVCFMRQVLTTVKLCSQDPELQRRVLTRVGAMLEDFPAEASPPENAAAYYRLIAEMTGVADPFAEIKDQANRLALSMEPAMSAAVAQAADPLLAAIRFAIGANVLDNGAQRQLDLDTTLAECQQGGLAIDHYPQLEAALARRPRVLYLADNCGEIVFDKQVIRVLLERGCSLTLAVRASPVINDATLEDARFCGLEELCPVISNGADVPGTSLERCSAEFRQAFAGAELIISKGMGNFECLSEARAPIVFLFTVKCSSVLAHLRADHPQADLRIGSAVLLASETLQAG